MGSAYTKPEVETRHLPGLVEKIPDQKGKVIVITGTTSGTGNVAARTLAKKGATVVMLNRDSERAEEALKEIKSEHPNSDVHWVECDLMSLESVRSAAAKVRQEYPAVDVLANNAGVMAVPRKDTKDGYDVQLQTNHLAGFLLAKELYPCLKAAAEKRGEARIVQQTSIARFGENLKATYFEKNPGELGGDGWALQNALMLGGRWVRYQQSKLANAVFTFALRDKLNQAGVSGVKALVAHPGLSATNLQSVTAQSGGMQNGVLSNMLMKMSQSPEDGAAGLLYCMAMPNVRNGDFYGPGANIWSFTGAPQLLQPRACEDDPAQHELLWKVSEDAVGAFDVTK